MRSRSRAASGSPVVVTYKSVDSTTPYTIAGTLNNHQEFEFLDEFGPRLTNSNVPATSRDMAQVNGYIREQSPLSPQEVVRMNTARVASFTKSGK